MVTAFEIEGWDRNAGGRVVFSGTPSDRFEYLIGTLIDRYVLTVDDKGSATLVVPPGQRVIVLTTTD